MAVLAQVLAALWAGAAVHAHPVSSPTKEGSKKNAATEVWVSPPPRLKLHPLQTAKPAAVPCSHGEPFNVLRYNLQQKYDSHYDSFGGCTARSRIRWCDAVEWPCCARSLNPCQPAGKASVASSVQPAMLRSCPGLFCRSRGGLWASDQPTGEPASDACGTIHLLLAAPASCCPALLL